MKRININGIEYNLTPERIRRINEAISEATPPAGAPRPPEGQVLTRPGAGGNIKEKTMYLVKLKDGRVLPAKNRAQADRLLRRYRYQVAALVYDQGEKKR